MNFLIDVKENKNIFEVPYSYIYEGNKGFVVIDYKGDCVFVNTELYENVEHLFDNATTDSTIITTNPDNEITDVTNLKEEEIEFGKWSIVSDSVLIVKSILVNNKLQYWFLQTNSARSYYVARGLNFLNQGVVVIFKPIDITKLSNEAVTSEGGYSPSANLNSTVPANWPTSWWTGAGYEQNNIGEWVKKGTITTCIDITWVDEVGVFRCVNNVSEKQQKSNCGTYRWVTGGTSCTEVIVSSELVPYALEAGNNTFNLLQFDTVTVPKGFVTALGYGSPIYSNLGTRDGVLIPFKVGYTHYQNITTMPLSVWTTDNKTKGNRAYYFQQFHWLVSKAVQAMQGSILAEYGNLTGLYNPSLPVNEREGKDYRQVTSAGAIAIGKIIAGNAGSIYNNETNTWNIEGLESNLMMDEEAYTMYSNYISFISNIYKGMYLQNPKLNIKWYGAPVTWFIVNNVNVSQLTVNDIENQIKTGYTMFSEFTNSRLAVDLSVGYFKVPGIEKNAIYKKDLSSRDAGFLIVNGKRVYSTDTLTETHYGNTVTIYPEPHEFIKFYLINGSGNKLFGSQYIDNPNSNPTIKQQYYDLGYRFYADARPNPSQWQPETQLYVEQIYRYANTYLLGMLLLNREEFKDFNLTNYRERKLQFGAVRCPNTEPFTPFGNSIERRYTGEQLSLFEYAFALLSGVTHIETWADGINLSSTPPSQGNPTYTQPVGETYLLNNSAYVVHSAVINTIFKALEGIDPSEFKYIHFYMPFIGEQNSEIIAVGIYARNKFVSVYMNPSLEYNELQQFTLTTGNVETKLSLNGRKTLIKILEVPTGLGTDQFRLQYFNIYNKFINVNGKISEKVSNHYI